MGQANQPARCAAPERLPTMYTRIIAALTTFLISSTALAWGSVPIHLCTVPNTPTPVGNPIPCSYQ